MDARPTLKTLATPLVRLGWDGAISMISAMYYPLAVIGFCGHLFFILPIPNAEGRPLHHLSILICLMLVLSVLYLGNH